MTEKVYIPVYFSESLKEKIKDVSLYYTFIYPEQPIEPPFIFKPIRYRISISKNGEERVCLGDFDELFDSLNLEFAIMDYLGLTENDMEEIRKAVKDIL